MTLKDVLRAAARGWWLLGLALLIGLAAGELVAERTTPLYRSSTSLFVSASSPTDPSAAYTGNLFTEGRVASYVQLVEGQRLSREVIGDLRLRMTPAQLASEVTATAETGTVILDVTVTDTSPTRARDIAAAYARHATADITALERPAGATASAVAVSTVQPATLDTTPVSPNRVRDVALGGLVGLLLGLGLAVLRARWHPEVRTPDDVEKATGAAVLAVVPRDRRPAKRTLADLLDPTVVGTDAVRLLRTRLFGPGGSDFARGAVVVSSARAGEGRSTLAVQLATSLARTGHSTLLVDADLEGASLTRELGLGSAPGLTEAVAGVADVLTAVQDLGEGRPAFLPAGRAPADLNVTAGTDRGALFDDAKARTVLDALRQAYDCVVVDGPPLLAEAGAASLAALGDGCVLVSRTGQTRRKDLREAARLLSCYGADLLGAVLDHGRPRQSATGGRRVRYDPDAARRRAGTRAGTRAMTPVVPLARQGSPESGGPPRRPAPPAVEVPPLLQQDGGR